MKDEHSQSSTLNLNAAYCFNGERLLQVSGEGLSRPVSILGCDLL